MVMYYCVLDFGTYPNIAYALSFAPFVVDVRGRVTRSYVNNSLRLSHLMSFVNTFKQSRVKLGRVMRLGALMTTMHDSPKMLPT